jgi:hypothetical protein
MKVSFTSMTIPVTLQPMRAQFCGPGASMAAGKTDYLLYCTLLVVLDTPREHELSIKQS